MKFQNNLIDDQVTWPLPFSILYSFFPEYVICIINLSSSHSIELVLSLFALGPSADVPPVPCVHFWLLLGSDEDRRLPYLSHGERRGRPSYEDQSRDSGRRMGQQHAKGSDFCLLSSSLDA